MRSIFVTATGTDVGKTHTSLRLIEALATAGYTPGVFKPIETGVSGTPQDASLLLERCQHHNDNFLSLSPTDVTAYTFSLPAAPLCADKKKIVSIDTIVDTYRRLSSLCDILVVEGAGGLMVPVTETTMMIDLITLFESKALLVTPSRLGCINETLLSIEALKTRNVDFDWCVNLYEEKEHFATVTQPYYDAHFPDWWSVEEGLQRFVDAL